MRLMLPAFTLLFASAFLLAADAPKPVPNTVHSGYFVSNKYEPDAPASFAVVQDAKAFEEMFKAVPPLMGQKQKPNLVPPNAFETLNVVAVVHRGNASWTYTVNSVTLDGKTLIVDYAVDEKPLTYQTATPLIVSVPKGEYKSVKFVENGKEARTVEVGPAADKK